jgi:glycosyltransferase involved in cell wall biosynthesis
MLNAVTTFAPTGSEIVRIPMGASPAAVDRASIALKLRSTHRNGVGPLLVFVGRLVDEKGVDDFLAAVARLRTHRPDVRGLIVGDGPDRASLEQLARKLRIDDRVTFVGWVDPLEVGDYLKAADVFVGPSRETSDGRGEGQGLTFVEAMFAGTPIVATNIGGIPDAVRHRETGLLVPQRSPDRIVEAVLAYLEDSALVARVRVEARKLAEREFTRRACAEAFARLYARIVAAHARR